jgi:RNA polymerase sigma-70 factor (ECF subfamily)
VSAQSPNEKSTLRLVPVGPRSDSALCRDFLVGDSNAFSELVRRHQELVFRLLRRYTRTVDDALDLSQRAFLQAFEAARRALPRLIASTNEVPFKAWLLRIAVNLAKNHVRNASRWPLAPLEAVDAEARSSELPAADQLIRAQNEALTRRAVLQLPRRQREVLTLRIDGGLSFAEVAQTLAITEGNAKTHFHYAVRRLRDEVRRLAPDALEDKS